MRCLKLTYNNQQNSVTPLTILCKIGDRGYIDYPHSFTEGYKFGFNGQERDDEVAGAGNSYTAEFWQYDPRLGRRFNLDPKPMSVGISPYACLGNSPIWMKDVKGDSVEIDLFPGKDDAKFKDLAKIGGLVKEHKNDGVFVVFAHGGPDGIAEGGKGKHDDQSPMYDEAQIVDLLKEKSPEFKQAWESGQKMTIVLMSCNTGNSEDAKENTPIAQKIANLNENVQVVAPTGYALYGKLNNEPHFWGVRKWNGQKGEFETFQKQPADIKEKKKGTGK